MIIVTSTETGLYLRRGDAEFYIADSDLPTTLASLIAHLTGRTDYSQGYQDGLADGYGRAEAEYEGRVARPPRAQRRAVAGLLTEGTNVSL